LFCFSKIINPVIYWFTANSSFTLDNLIFLLPIIKTKKLPIAQAHITAAIGIAVPLFKILTKAVEIAPIPSCMAPISADAVPAFLVNGAKESAEEFGKANPWVLRKTQIKKMVEYNPRKWK
jgi:hypothetical protein